MGRHGGLEPDSGQGAVDRRRGCAEAGVLRAALGEGVLLGQGELQGCGHCPREEKRESGLSGSMGPGGHTGREGVGFWGTGLGHRGSQGAEG